MILAVTIKGTGILIGSIGLYINKKHDIAELGYWIGKEYWNQGYCSETVKTMISFAFEEIHLNKIYAYFLCRNLASGKVLVKNGFVKEGFFKQHVKYNDKYEDVKCFSLLKSDYIQTLNLE